MQIGVIVSVVAIFIGIVVSLYPLWADVNIHVETDSKIDRKNKPNEQKPLVWTLSKSWFREGKLHYEISFAYSYSEARDWFDKHRYEDQAYRERKTYEIWDEQLGTNLEYVRISTQQTPERSFLVLKATYGENPLS